MARLSSTDEDPLAPVALQAAMLSVLRSSFVFGEGTGCKGFSVFFFSHTVAGVSAPTQTCVSDPNDIVDTMKCCKARPNYGSVRRAIAQIRTSVVR